jgi:hypothetical protein
MPANDTINVANEIAKKGFERLASLGELNVRIFERLIARQIDAANLYVEHGARVAKLATESKGYDELVKAQAEAAKELGERLLAESKTNASLAGEVRDDYRVWVEKNLAELNADLRKAVPAAA